MDTLTILIVVMVSQVYSHVKTYQIVHFNCVQYIVCQLYFNKSCLKTFLT